MLQATIPGSARRGHVAVVAGVALEREARARVARLGVEVLRLVHVEPQVRDHLWVGLVADVDDPPGADLVDWLPNSSISTT